MEQLSAGCISQSLEQTQALAATLAELIPVDTVLTLHGDLGAGKTSFVQGMAKAWGINTPVTSPTFALYNLYSGSRQLVHLDAYRLEGGGEGEALLLEDMLESPWCIVAEWPEKIAGAWWLEDAWQLHMENAGELARHIKLIIP